MKKPSKKNGKTDKELDLESSNYEINQDKPVIKNTWYFESLVSREIKGQSQNSHLARFGSPDRPSKTSFDFLKFPRFFQPIANKRNIENEEINTFVK